MLDANRNEIEIPELDPEDMPQPPAPVGRPVVRSESAEDVLVAAEEEEEMEQAAEDAFNMSEDDLSLGSSAETDESIDELDFPLPGEDAEGLDDFSVDDLSDLDLDDDI